MLLAGDHAAADMAAASRRSYSQEEDQLGHELLFSLGGTAVLPFGLDSTVLAPQTAELPPGH